jgi:Ala-tRNA(Pro) deacylase
MPLTRLHKLLEQQHVPYETIRHRTAFSAQQTAEAAHVPGHELAKAVIVEIDGELAMVVQAASGMAPLGRVKAATGARDVHLVSEQEFKDRFPDCELGAMPPFGNLYGMDTYVTEVLTHDEEIAFNAGSHTELVRLRYSDFERLVHPTVI